MDESQENLKTIWFEGEMLPNWAQLLEAMFVNSFNPSTPNVLNVVLFVCAISAP